MPHFPDKQIGIRHQHGFSLIESLVSALILGIALFGLAGFHAAALKDGSLVKARSAAASLAQEKLDDLRSFTRLADDPSTTGVDECATPTFCFSEIVASQDINVNIGGGREYGGNLPPPDGKNAGDLLLPSGTIAGYIDNYTRGWTVTCAIETAGSALVFGGICTGATAKLVTVSIAWTDNKGATQPTRPVGTVFNSLCGISAPYTCHSVSLQSVIYAMDPLRLALGTASSFSTQRPKVGYTPNADSVPIAIGGGKSTETSRPLPEVSGGDSRRVTLPSVVYTGASGSETIVAKEEFATVNCTCKLNDTGIAWTPHRMMWNGSALEQEKGVEVTKVVGKPSDLSNNGTTNQDPLCIECCRDHHDTNTATTESGSAPGYPAYRPYAPVADFLSGTGNHKHYKTDGSVATLTTDVYVEACRIKRVDGYWRVAADWRLIDLATYGCDYFVDMATYQCLPTAPASETKLDSYRNWIKNVLKAFVGYLDTNKTVNTTSTTMPVFSSGVAPLLDVNNAAHDVILAQGTNKQLITRGIYADVVFKKKSSGAPRTVDTDYVTAVLPVFSINNFDKLQYLPFYDANLTLLANWSPTSTNSSGNNNPPKPGDCSPAVGTITYDTTPSPSSAVCVTSEAIKTISDSTLGYYNDYYSRGKLYGKGSSGSTLIAAKVARGNNGLTSSASINGTTDSVQERQVMATIPASGTTVGVSGRVIRGNSGAMLSNITITAAPSSGVSCAFTNPAALATASAADYSCSVPSGWSGTLTFGGPVGYTFNPNVTTATITAPAAVADVIVYGPTASLYGRLYANSTSVSQVLITTSTGQTCTVSSTVITCANVPLTSGTWSGTVTIANNSTCGSGSSLCTNNLKVGAAITTANDCTSGDTGAKTTGQLSTGPSDLGSTGSPSTSITFCAK